MDRFISRRRFLGGTAAAGAMLMTQSGHSEELAVKSPLEFPLVDLHVHLDGSTLEKVLELSRERGVKFGIVQHAGTKANQYPVVLSNDAELDQWVAMLEGKPVYKGVQAEYTDWRDCFSARALKGLDYVLTDAWTIPGPDGRRMKLWEKNADIGDPKTFMDRYVDWYVEILTGQPVDILANVSWLPRPLTDDYDAQWTETRMGRVIEAAVKHGVAIEIGAGLKLPKLPFLKLAKQAGAKFTFGTNGRYPNMGKLDYAIAMAKELGLKASDMFLPTPGGAKAARASKA